MSLENKLGLSPRIAERLRALGYSSVKDLEDLFIPSLLEAGFKWSTVKTIVKALVQHRVKLCFDAPDATWTEERWKQLVEELVSKGLVKWEEVAVCVLGELNPPQVGTSTASNPNFKRHYGPRECMRAVLSWFYAQNGRCASCGSRLHLEADHIKGKAEFHAEGQDPSEADTLSNLQLLCKRCNVVKRESHLLGGLSFHTAQAALMWILLVKRPATYGDYRLLCRRAGLTMADVRFQEAWAMAEWLRRDGLYP